jgi:acyl-CoA synthetase (NDP forming)
MPGEGHREARRAGLARMLAPRSVAIVGGALATDAVAVCRDGGFEGAIWPVTRRAGEVAGLPAYPSIAALPGSPDAALVLAPPEASVAAVAGLAARGCGGAVCYAAGFAELGAEGVALQRRLVEAAGAMAVVGPNCNGVVNRLADLYLWPNPEHPVARVERGVALVTQSGAIACNASSSERSLPLAAILSIGNQAALDVADCVAVLAENPGITAIGLHLESIPDVPAFSAAAAGALAAGKPLVLLKGGVTAAGAAKAGTHSGALAIPDRLLSALCDRHGVLRVGSLAALLETLKMVALAGAPSGPRLAAITLSGGIATLVADRASAAGLALPRPGTAAALRPLVPAVLPIANPLDCSPPLRSESGLAMTNEPALAELFAAMLRGGYDAGLLCLDFPHPRVGQAWLWDPSVRAMIAAARAAAIPCAVASMLPEALPEPVRDMLAAAGIAPLQGLEEAIGAIALAVRWGAARRSAPADPLPVRPAPRGTPRLRDEVESKGLLAAEGIAVPEGLVGSAAQVPALAERLGFPVALKAVDARLPHKAAVGALALNLRDADAVRGAVARIRSSVARAVPGVVPDRFLVERMVEGAAVEAMVGIARDPAFGPTLVVGRGGSGVEHGDDTAALFLPASRDEVVAALEGSRLGRTLRERGVDAGPLVDVILAIARFAIGRADRLGELDANPVLVLEDGRAVAVDALIALADGEEGT